MSAHTPGPWHVEIQDNSLLSLRHANGPRKHERIELRHGHARTYANARLIAAAPELLAALKSLVASADIDHNSEEDSHYRLVGVDEVEAARAAIAKAEGRS